MITFQPTYKLFLDCNHRPVITDPNDAIWNRVKCIPFKVQIPDAEIDKDLLAKLRTERAGILRWLVVEDRCLLANSGNEASWKQEGCWVPVSKLYAAYLSWSEVTGNKYPLSKDSFDERLQKLGTKRDRVRPDRGRYTKQIRVCLESGS